MRASLSGSPAPLALTSPLASVQLGADVSHARSLMTDNGAGDTATTLGLIYCTVLH